MGRSRIGWAVGVVAPWCLGFGVALSFPADAGQPATVGGSIAALTLAATAMPDDLVPASSAALTGDLGTMLAPGRLPIVQASLAVGPADAFRVFNDEIEPRADMKRTAGAMPQIDRSHKSDPAVGLRPTFDTRMREKGGVERVRLSDALFTIDDATPTGALTASEGNVDGPESVDHFEPWADGESPTTVHSAADASPNGGGGSTMTMRPAAINERNMQGATPAVGRAVALASTTPAPADATPIEALVAPAGAPPAASANISRIPQDRPNYAALIDPEQASREKRCLAEAVYFEARSEPVAGQAAVAQVVLNRVRSGLYPSSICGVVYQNRHHYNACQFSFACEGKSLRVTEPEAWRTAVKVAEDVTSGTTYLSDVGGATHYHANYVKPRWARSLVKMDVIGHHVFYKLHPGQT
jgi:spore germination cell wall hydrolase CwlJ-like protein